MPPHTCTLAEARAMTARIRALLELSDTALARRGLSRDTVVAAVWAGRGRI